MMAEPMLYRIVDDFPYLGREDEYPRLTADEAAFKFEDLTGEKVDEVLAELAEPCGGRCRGKGTIEGQPTSSADVVVPCPDCAGTGRRHDPIEWEDKESGRTVTLRPEVS